MAKLISIFINYSIMYTLLVGCEQIEETKLGNCTLDSDLTTLSEEEKAKCVLPEQELNSDLEINATLNAFNEAEEVKMRNALSRLKIVINSTKFKQRVLEHTYNGEQTFVDNNGLTNEEVYDSIMQAAETLNGEIDNEIDIDITLYFANNSTVGYTYPNVNKIWVNKKFFASYTLAKVAANVAHEWTHKLGFGHDFNRTSKRNYSVPYAVGNIVRDLIDEMSVEEI